MELENEHNGSWLNKTFLVPLNNDKIELIVNRSQEILQLTFASNDIHIPVLTLEDALLVFNSFSRSC